MKYLLLLFFFAATFTSCRTFQCITVKNNKVEPTLNGDFIFENDSALITYNFKGQDFPVNIRFENKLDKPVVIDWKRSAIVVNGESRILRPAEAKTTGTATSRPGVVSPTPKINTEYSSVTILPEDGTVVPPKAFITHTYNSITNKRIGLPANHPTGYVAKEYIAPDGKRYKTQEATFTEEWAPMNFRVFLTGVIETDGMPRTVSYDHAFYVASLMKTRKDPYHLDWTQAYVRMGGTTVGEVVLGTVVFGVLAAVAVAKVVSDDKNDKK